MSAIRTEGATRTEPSEGLAPYLVTVELKRNGRRQIVGVVCDARSRELAEQIAWDVNEDEPHVYIRNIRKLDELQIINPLSWDTRRGLIREHE
jgi:hypothetical protein